jgi:hypothetical protein
MTQISCVYSRTATGRLALVFAADLWSKLHGVKLQQPTVTSTPLKSEMLKSVLLKTNCSMSTLRSAPAGAALQSTPA